MKNKLFPYWCIFLLCISSCQIGKDGKLKENVYSDKIDFNQKEVLFSPQTDILFLKEYFLSSSYHQDSADVFVSYNYKRNALDFLDLKDGTISQTKLEPEGPKAIGRIYDIFVHNMDSIWICGMQDVFLINKAGELMKKIPLIIEPTEGLCIDTNYAISTIKLYYNNERKSLFYTTGGLSDDVWRFYVNELSLTGSNEIKRYKLSLSDVEPKIDGSYGYMTKPNITFNDNKILYNFPIESNIYVLDLKTGENHIYGGSSKYTENTAHKDPSLHSFEASQKYDVENLHFYEVMYIPKYDLYCRLHLNGIEFDVNKNREELYNSKDIFLTVFNSKFEVVNEIKLPSKRYSYLTAWCPLNNGFLIFANNYYLDASASENNILFDIYEPVMKNN